MGDLFFFLQTLPEPESHFACWYGLITSYRPYVSGILGLGGGGRGLFWKNVFQGGCPQYTTAKQFFWFRP